MGLEEFIGFAIHGLAIFLQLEKAGLLPGSGPDLEEISALQEELEVRVTFQTFGEGET